MIISERRRLHEERDYQNKDKLKSMRGFRNIVVHRYGAVDDKIAFEILRENLPDFYLFIDWAEYFLA